MCLKQNWCILKQKWCDFKKKHCDLEHEWRDLEQMWFRAKKRCALGINHAAESQSDCRDQQWFQNGYNEEENSVNGQPIPSFRNSRMNGYKLCRQRFLASFWWQSLLMIGRCYLRQPLINLIIHSKYFPDSDWLKAHA